MRSYSNFLLFEDVLEYLPTTAPGITRAANLLINPQVTLVEEDCGTILGKQETLSFASEGLIELATDAPLVRSRIISLLAQGKYKISIRDPSTCTSDGGICKKCFNASILDRGLQVKVGDKVSMTNQYIYHADALVGPGNTFPLTKSLDLYNLLIVIKSGVVLASSTYSVSNQTLTLNLPLGPSDSVVVYYLKFSDNLLLNYLAKSYSGSLIGLLPLLSDYLPIPSQLYQSFLSDSLLALMKIEISGYKDIPLDMIDYIDVIIDKLEKALYIILLYAIYDGGSSDRITPSSNVGIATLTQAIGASFFTNLGFTPGQVIAGGVIPGATLGYSQWINPGAASIGAGLNGATLVEGQSIYAGTAHGNSSTQGGVFSESLSLLTGTPSAGATLVGGTFSEVLSISSGVGTVTAGAVLPGSGLSETMSLSPGYASITAAVAGISLSEVFSIGAGSASVGASVGVEVLMHLNNDIQYHVNGFSSSNWYPTPALACSNGATEAYGGSKHGTDDGTNCVVYNADNSVYTTWGYNSLLIPVDVKGHATTVSGNTINSSAQSKFGGQSLSFDGASSWATIFTVSGDPFLTGDFTIEFWMKQDTSGGSTTPVLIDNYNSAATHWQIKATSTNIVWNNDNIHNYATSSSVLDGSWHAIAIVRSGTDRYAFVDGVQLGSPQTDSASYTDSGAYYIGAQVESRNSAYDFKGWIDELRITKAALYTASYTPATTAFSDT